MPTNLTPEQKARKIIDSQFSAAGWEVVSRDSYSPIISAAAIEEGLLNHNLEADYLLFINGMAVGVLEAKKEEYDIDCDTVKKQAENYVRNVPPLYNKYSKVLPLIFISNGKRILFKDCRNEEAEYKELNAILSPKQVAELLGINDTYAGLPALPRRGLRDCQYEAVSELEKSFRAGQNRALIVLATGAGKTYTACTICYRLLSYTPMKRVLFLVDRNNLGKQADDEFGKYKLTESGDKFNDIYTVNRLKKAEVPKDSNIVISTIQRLFSLLSGQEIDDTDEDEDVDAMPNTDEQEVTLPENPKLPKDFFDAIIIDECHRSIYGKWRQVLEYFNQAKLIGLTATPGPETLAFFNNNRVVNYTLEKSIIDGVNVGYSVYRIKTKATEDGGAIKEGDSVKKITRYTGEVEEIKQKQNQNYTAEELNRSIVNPAQIKLILETYRDAIYTEMFTDPQREPDMNYIPKTLIFALSEAHANNIVKIAKEVFGRDANDDKFVQRITCKAGDSNKLIREFRTDKEFRIAVTVTLVATGTDVKPLEVVMFMRDVQSEQLYIQMKGRGCRTISDAALQQVTPNAFSKDQFFLVDAVGVTEHAKSIVGPTTEPTQPVISLKDLLEKITHGNLPDDYLSTLAFRLSRIHTRCDEEQRTEFENLAHSKMEEIASNIMNALVGGNLPPYISNSEPNCERKGLVAPIVNHPKAKDLLLRLNAGFVKILYPGEDELIEKGFTQDEAKETTEAFEEYIKEHKDEIEALRLIYNNAGEPITASMLEDLRVKLLQANGKFGILKLWNNYSILNPEKVEDNKNVEQRKALTTLIQIVRYAYGKIDKLTTLHGSANQFFNLWCGQAQRPLTEKQKELLKQIVDYIISNGCCQIIDIRVQYKSVAQQLIYAFGDKDTTNDAIVSLSKFLIYRKSA